MTELYRYAAFISYSSKDAVFSRRLHKSLEAYVIPGQLGKFDLIGGGKINRIYPVFRDREELAAGSLGENIQAALRAAGSLIVICSPNAAGSPWVQKEIEFFCSMGRQHRVYAIIAENVPLVGASGADLTRTCFPAALGSTDVVGNAAPEPIAADARPGKDGYRNAYLKLVAGLIGVSAGVLHDRDRRRRRRQLVINVSALVTLAFAIVTAVAIALTAADRGKLTARAIEEVGLGNTNAALPFAIAGTPPQGALFAHIDPQAAETLHRLSATKVIATFNAGKSFSISGNQDKLAAIGTDGTVSVYDFSGSSIRELKAIWKNASSVELSADGTHAFVVGMEGGAALYRADSNVPVKTFDNFKKTDTIWLSADLRRVISKSRSDHVTVFDLESSTHIDLGKLVDPDEYGLSDNGRFFFAQGINGTITVLDSANPGHSTTMEGRRDFQFSGDGKRVAFVDDDGSLGVTGLDVLGGIEVKFADQDYKNVKLTYDGSILFNWSGSDAGAFVATTDGNEINISGLKELHNFELAPDGSGVLIVFKNNDGYFYPRKEHAERIYVGNLGSLYRVFLVNHGNRLVAIDRGRSARVFDIGSVKATKAPVADDAAAAACSAAWPLIPLFSPAQRSGRERSELATILRGRPWNPCDWRGIGAVWPNPDRGDRWFEGLRQWLRFTGVRMGLPGMSDWSCTDGVASIPQVTTKARAEACAALVK